MHHISVALRLHHILYVFDQIVAFKVHGVVDKEPTVEEKKVPPVENRKLSGGIIALVAVASLVAVIIIIFIIFQLVSYFYFYALMSEVSLLQMLNFRPRPPNYHSEGTSFVWQDAKLRHPQKIIWNVKKQKKPAIVRNLKRRTNESIDTHMPITEYRSLQRLLFKNGTTICE